MKEQVRVEILEVGPRRYVGELWRKGRKKPSFTTLELRSKRSARGVIQMLALDLGMEISNKKPF